MKFSIIDVSSSSISLLVAEIAGAEEETVFRDRASLTLMHYLDGRCLSRRGIQKLTDAVSVMKEKCVSLGADVLFLISTAALRAIENFEEVHAAILDATGVPVNFIDAETEAYCGYVANRGYGKGAVLMDIGGASIEVCDLGKEDASGRRCLNFGVLNLHEKFVRKIQPDAEEAKAIAKYVDRKFDKAGLPGEGVYGKVVLAGATNLALYSVYAEYAGAKEEDGRTMRYKKFKKLVKHLVTGSGRSRLILDAAPEKLYSVGIAAIVAKAFAKRLGAETIAVSENGVKEGYLRLVCEGKLHGAFYDFNKDECYALAETDPAARAVKGESAQPATKRRGRRPAAKPAEEDEAAAKEENAQPAAKPAEEDKAAAKEENAQPATKRRGRRPAAKPAEEDEAAAKEKAEAPAAKRRGRRPAAKPAEEDKAAAKEENAQSAAGEDAAKGEE